MAGGRRSVIRAAGVAAIVVASFCALVSAADPARAAGFAAKFNFQPASAPVPSGYQVDSGAAWSDTAGFGWVRQDSLGSATHVPLDITPNTRDRNVESDQRLDTLIHMQYPTAGTANVTTPAAWEVAVPNGSYVVTVAVGDPVAGTDPENHVIHVEGQTAIAGFVPSGVNGSATRHATATVTASVSDGRLTIDAIGGTNTKLDYVDIAAAAPDTTPPAAPANVQATAGNQTVQLSWTANTESDLAGYNVYRSTSLPVPTTTPLNASLLQAPGYSDTGLSNGTTYDYVVRAVDTSGNTADAAPVSATPTATAPPTSWHFNFQPAGSPVPAGYTVDSGLAWDATRGFGWVRQDSLSTSTHVPLDISPNTRDRNVETDQRTDTLIHMQYPTAGTANVTTPAAWELAVPNGTYTVTVTVGDPVAGTDPENHVIHAEGQVAIGGFVPSGANGSATRHATGTVATTVSDGRLTIDAIGGTNTKLDYIDITTGGTPPPPPPPPTQITWSTVAAAPIPRHEGGSAVVGGKLYAFGGYTDNTATPTARVDAYDPATNTWQQRASLPVAATHMGVVTDGTDVYFAGGYPLGSSGTGQTFSTAAVWKYTPSTDTWTSMPSLPAPRGGGALALVGRTLHFFGGADANRADANTHWTLNLDGGTSWVTAAPMPVGRNHLGAVTIGGKIYAVAGQQGQDAAAVYSKAVDVFDPSTGAWTSAPSLPVQRSHHGAATFIANGKLFVIGGETAFGHPTNEVDVYDPVANAWGAGTALPVAHDSGIGGVINGVLYYTGGNLSTTTYKGSLGTSSGAPAPPSGVSALPGDRQVTLNWTANTESDLAGYNVYRSTSTPVPTTTPLNTGLLNSPTYLDTGLTNGTTYFYVVEAVDSSGLKGDAPAVSATPAAAPSVDVKVNFQDQATVPPAGYTKDFGESYGPRTGTGEGSGLTYGWVSPGTSTPVSLIGNGRNRNNPPDSAGQPDLRLATFIHMQYTGTNGVDTPGAWELAVPSGVYDVTVAVGDASPNFDSVHRINIEGQLGLYNFVPTSTNRFQTVTRTVPVTDGRLTIDPMGGTNTKIDYVTVASDNAQAGHPYVTKTAPVNAAVGVGLSAPVTAEVSLPHVGAGVDDSTLTSNSVRLTKLSDGSQVPAVVNTTGGGDAIILQPSADLQANTAYRFDVTSAVKDFSGSAFLPWSSTFTTGTTGGTTSGGNIAFDKVDLPNATGDSFTSLVKGPDGMLYASTIDGLIYRFPIGADGVLGVPQIINSVQTANGGPRFLIGMAFDPASTATNLILWVTSSAYAFTDAPDWTGKISRLSGPNLATVTDYVVNLPRSIRDHATNSLAFGPDGALYVSQGSESSMGGADPIWGNRDEHLLNAAILRVDVSKITSPPLNVQTDSGGTYNPFAAGAPVTLYATGIRNAYDLVWDSNGKLYAPTNGAASGGNTPATPATLPASCASRIDAGTNGAYTGPQVPALTDVPDAQDDFLFNVVKGGYYGHPDPARCEWVLNGGNPTSGVDRAEVTEYPVGTQPDRNWRGAAYDFGQHYSPDGVFEYRGNAFGGALDHALLITRYSAGDDLIALTLDASGNVTGAMTGMPGTSSFVDPIDVTEDQSTGNVYVSEFGANKITLLRPVSSTAAVAAAPARLLFNQVQNTGPTATQDVTLTNSGSTARSLTSLTLTGTDAAQFQIVSPPTLPASIPAGGSLKVHVAFSPTSTGPKGAALQAQTDDPAAPSFQITLRGLGTLGLGGANEPSLQWILDTWQLPINVGDTDPTNSALPATPLLGDEVAAQSFVKAGTGAVTLEPLAVFGPQSTAGSVTTFGYYTTGNAASTQGEFTVPNASYPSIQPTTSGTLSFDPGSGSFGFYATWPFFSGHNSYSEDALNTWEPTVANRHKVRVYPLKTTLGAVVANAYVVAVEDSTAGYDYQDVVTIVRNVKPASTSTGTVTLPAHFNFQPAASPVPTGYQVDSGAAWSDSTGFGWVRQDSLSSATHVPLDITPNTRDRNVETDQRLDTLIHMQYPTTGTAGVSTPAAWEVAVPNGSYTVTVAVGDPVAGTDPENHVIHVEGQTAIAGFVPSGANGSATRHATATVTSTVSDGRLTIDAIGGTNTKLDYVDIVPAAPDTTPPSVSVAVTGVVQSPGVYANRATVTVTSSDTGSGIASTTYSLDSGAFQTYSGPFDVTAVGSHTVVARAVDRAGNTTTSSTTSFSIVATAGSNARVTLQNLDGAPYDDRMVFSTIASKGTNVVHDHATLRIKNTGTDPLHITGLPLTGPFALTSPPTLPATVAAGGQLDVTVQFTATSGRVSNGTLTVQSDDPTAPNAVVQLRGYWQSVPENGQEPSLEEIVGMMGYQTTILGPNQQLDQNGFVTAVGDEVLSPYWQRSDTSKPVTVRQLASFHTQNTTATFYWFAKGASGSLNTVFSSSQTDAQTLLPHLFNGGTNPAGGTFSPTATTFGLRVDSEISDDPLNNATPDRSAGCPGPCGHHMRFWTLKDRTGAVVPNTYLMSIDYNGINYDYNDNVYLISNIRPQPDGATQFRLDVGGASSFTDSLGRTWTPDNSTQFTPSSAIAEPGSLPDDVLNTTDDVIYRTYRGNVGSLTPRTLSYALPVPNGKYNVRLHFAERCTCDTTVGSRVFNVQIEGAAVSSNFDIVKAAGAANTALVVPYYHVNVADGMLNISFTAVVDYASIAGIEVVADP